MRQEQLPFSGTINGQTTSDRKAWPALVKAAPKMARSEFYDRGTSGQKVARVGYQADIGGKAIVDYDRKVRLTAVEREWLGANVTIDGLVGVWQVWSLASVNRYVWLVQNGELRCVHVDSLTVAV